MQQDRINVLNPTADKPNIPGKHLHQSRDHLPKSYPSLRNVPFFAQGGTEGPAAASVDVAHRLCHRHQVIRFARSDHLMSA